MSSYIDKLKYHYSDYTRIDNEEDAHEYILEWGKSGARALAHAKPEFRLVAVRLEPDALKGIPKSEQTIEQVEAALSKNGFTLRFASKKILNANPRLYEMAVKNYGGVADQVPEQFRYEGIWSDAVQSCGWALKLVPTMNIDKPLCDLAVSRHPESLKYVPLQFIDKDMCSNAVSRLGRMLFYVPEGLIDDDMMLSAVMQDGELLESIPVNKRDSALCKAAVMQNPLSLRFVPNKLKTKKLVREALLANGAALEFVPDPSDEDLNIALENTPAALRFFPEDKKTEENCVRAFARDWRSIIEIPSAFIRADMLVAAFEAENRLIDDTWSGNRVMKVAFYKRVKPEVLRDRRVAVLQRERGIRKLKKGGWVQRGSRFVVEESIVDSSGCDSGKRPVIMRTKSFEELYAYLEGDLRGIVFSGFDFSSIDASKYDWSKSDLTAEELMGIGAYDSNAYDALIGSDKRLAHLTASLQNEQTAPFEPISLCGAITYSKAAERRAIYYVSDIHLNHKLLNAFPQGATAIEIDRFISDFVDGMIASVAGMHWGEPLLVLGDTSYNFEVARSFFSKLGRRWHGTVICVLGNHELWECDKLDLHASPGSALNEIVSRYRLMLEECGVVLLQNEVLVYYRNERYIRISSADLANWDDERLQHYLERSPFAIVGGIGFTGQSDEFNAEAGIYRQIITSRNQDQLLSDEFCSLHSRIRTLAAHRSIIVATHTPMKDWSQDSYTPGWIYVNGHTHRNTYSETPDHRVYADNQIGYRGTCATLKRFYISARYDVFEGLPDGIHEITKDDYFDFNREKNIPIERFTREGKVFLLKRDGITCFLFRYAATGKLYLLSGARINRLEIQDANYYYDNMKLYADLTRATFSEYEKAIQKVSEEVQRIGGDGYIHGCIVDIDLFSHIYLDPFSGKLTFYYAESITDRVEYPTLNSLLVNHAPGLLQGPLGSMSVDYALFDEGLKRGLIGAPTKTSDSQMYKPSNVVRSVQYLFDDGVIRVWNDEVLRHISNTHFKSNAGKIEAGSSRLIDAHQPDSSISTA